MKPEDVLDRLMPDLKRDRYQVTSPADPQYNCIAWASGNDSRWWWPLPAGGGGNYWPAEIPRECTVERFVQAFALEGYQPCDGLHLEADVEKVAVYVNGTGVPTHAARQLPDGRWSSKLGPYVDIEHDAPMDVGGLTAQAYGDVAIVMSRPRR